METGTAGRVGATEELGTTGALGATEEGTRIGVVEVVHSVVVVVVVYCIGSNLISIGSKIEFGVLVPGHFRDEVECKQTANPGFWRDRETYGTVDDSRMARQDGQSSRGAYRISLSVPSTSLEGKGADGDEDD